MNRNLTAFLTTIAVSEGTAAIGSNNGYDVVVGGGLFTSYADHPRFRVWISAIQNYSTAAGRYQILARNYDAYRGLLKLKDFSPRSQDAIACQLITERLAMRDVLAGRLDVAVRKCAPIWASFPGAGYGQHENAMQRLREAFVAAGGVLAPMGDPTPVATSFGEA